MARIVKRLVICLDNTGYEASLEKRKIYVAVAVADAAAGRVGHLRVVDESGEGYLYPKAMFLVAQLPLAQRRAVLHAA
jgi:hypothetical protein